MSPSTQLNHRVAVITGSSRGVGLLIAKSLAAAGAHVVLSSRSQAAVDAAQQQIAVQPHQKVLGIACDVADLAQVDMLAQQTLEQLGAIDIWFNNAGITSPYGRTLEVPTSRWRDVIATNLLGTYHGTTVALKHMLPRNQGKIINLLGAGDQDSRIDKFGYMSAYATSKAAVRRFTLVIADEYRDTGISILGFSPGLVTTNLMTSIEPLTDAAAKRLQGLDLALSLFTTPLEQISKTVVDLASDPTNGTSGKIYRCRVNLSKILQRGLQRIAQQQ